jgi:hypothetical protein
MKRKQFKNLALIMLLTLTIIGCSTSDCPNAEDTIYNLSSDEKDKIPYESLDTLTLISNLGDSSIFYVVPPGKRRSFELEHEYSSPDCLSETIKFENSFVYFSRANLNQRISNVDALSYYYDKTIPNEFSKHHLQITIVDQSSPIKRFYFDLHNLTDSLYIDTVTINGILYKGLSATAPDNSKMIYNHIYGILKIDLLNGGIWTSVIK